MTKRECRTLKIGDSVVVTGTSCNCGKNCIVSGFAPHYDTTYGGPIHIQVANPNETFKNGEKEGWMTHRALRIIK